MSDQVRVTSKQAKIIDDTKQGTANKTDPSYDGRALRHLFNRGIVKTTNGGKLALTKGAENATFVATEV